MSTEQDKAATKLAEAAPSRRLSPYDAVAEAMRLASLMGGSIGMGNVEKAMAYETRLRRHLVEHIYPPESPLASLQQAVPSTVKDSLTDGEHAEPAQAAPKAEQAHAVGAGARAAALEEAALQCEAVKAEFEHMAQGANTGMYDHQAQGAETCAETIRSFAAIGGQS